MAKKVLLQNNVYNGSVDVAWFGGKRRITIKFDLNGRHFKQQHIVEKNIPPVVCCELLAVEISKQICHDIFEELLQELTIHRTTQPEKEGQVENGTENKDGRSICTGNR